MLSRYASEEIESIFSDASRMRLWRDVELAVVWALGEAGTIDREVPRRLLAAEVPIDSAFVDEVNAREQVTNHDLAAFVDVLQSRFATPAARYIHFGLTSSDVVDSALSLQLVAALDLVIGATVPLRDALIGQARRYRSTLMLGRTHGMAAEPTTFGAKLALFALSTDRELARLRHAQEQMRVGKLSGAVGTYSNISPEVERLALSRLGLKPVPATQVIARDRHAEVIYSLASLAATIETFALEIRHLQRSEVREVQEPFGKGQKGSSAMPHKRNPILSERLCGMARMARAAVIPALEDVALWHERDISHSSVERVMFPDTFHLAYYMATRMEQLVSGLVVFEERMLANLEATSGLVFSQSILLELVSRGMERDAAYRIVQEATARTLSGGGNLVEAVLADDRSPLAKEELEKLASADRVAANLDTLFAALDAIEGAA